jgi:predicted dehydrogenase
MLLENYNYADHCMTVLNMASKRMFGELTYAFGSYIHNVKELRFTGDGKLTWRGVNVQKTPGIIYPTHALGPIAWWMGIDGVNDRMVSMVAMASKSVTRHEDAVKRFGADSPAAIIDFANGDTNQALIKTAQGRLIELRYDTASNRPAGMGTYSLQGTRGAYESVIGQRLVYFEGKSPAEKWEPLEKYNAEFKHPRWIEAEAKASKAGHGGGDYFVIEDFLNAIRTGKSPIDIFDAVAWTSIRPLSTESILNGSKPVEIPDFRTPR